MSFEGTELEGFLIRRARRRRRPFTLRGTVTSVYTIGESTKCCDLRIGEADVSVGKFDWPGRRLFALTRVGHQITIRVSSGGDVTKVSLHDQQGKHLCTETTNENLPMKQQLGPSTGLSFVSATTGRKRRMAAIEPHRKVAIRLPDTLIDLVDRHAEGNRTAWIETAIEDRLRQIAFSETCRVIRK